MTILKEVVSNIFVLWHWKVFLNIEYWWYLDIPNLRNVDLPDDSFRNVQSKSISSIDWLIDLIWFIDISTTIYKNVPLSKNELQAIDISVTSIIIPNWTCNDIDYSISRDLVLLNQLKSVIIVLNQWKHSKSKDWIDWKVWKSESIHLIS